MLGREVDLSDGSIYWTINGEALLDEVDGTVVRDTQPIWAPAEEV